MNHFINIYKLTPLSNEMNQRLIVIAGTPCVGKTTVARGLAKSLTNSILLEKDVLNQSLSEVRPTNNGNLPGAEEYLSSQPTESGEDIFGKLIRVPERCEFYGRHVREQTYRAMIDIANANLKEGKSPIFESLLSRQFGIPGLVQGILDEFKPYECLMLYVHIPEEEIKIRMQERIKTDNYYKLVDGPKLKSQETWETYMEKFPIFPENLDDFNHFLIDGMKSPDECVEESLSYVKK